MTKKILLTSFTTGRPHQKSNSSDDLLIEVAKDNCLSASLSFLRQLPVDIEQASSQAIAQVNKLNPDLIICCGMAENRQILTVESNAKFHNHFIETWVDLYRLVTGLKQTGISHDAGKFVGEGLYYSMLKYLRDRQLKTPCIFVHVPLLYHQNLPDVKADFVEIIKRLITLV